MAHEDTPSVATPALLYVAEMTDAQHKAAQQANAMTTRRAALVVEVAALEERLALLARRNREVLAPLEQALWETIGAARAASCRGAIVRPGRPDTTRAGRAEIARPYWLKS